MVLRFWMPSCSRKRHCSASIASTCSSIPMVALSHGDYTLPVSGAGRAFAHPGRPGLYQVAVGSPDGKLVATGYDPGIITTPAIMPKLDWYAAFRDQLGLFAGPFQLLEHAASARAAEAQKIDRPSDPRQSTVDRLPGRWPGRTGGFSGGGGTLRPRGQGVA